MYYDEVPATCVQSSSGDSGSQTPTWRSSTCSESKCSRAAGYDLRRQLADRCGALHREQAGARRGRGQFAGRRESLQHAHPGATAAATFNLPLIDDKLALRATAYYEKTPGLCRQTSAWATRTSTRRRDDRGPRDAAFQPVESATIDAMIWLQKREVDGASGYHAYDTSASAAMRHPGFLGPRAGVCLLRHGTVQHTATTQTTKRPATRRSTVSPGTQDLPWPTLTDCGLALQARFGFFRDNTWAIIS